MGRIICVSNYIYSRMPATLALISNLFRKLSGLKYRSLGPLVKNIFLFPTALLEFKIVETIRITWEGDIFCFKILDINDKNLWLLLAINLHRTEKHFMLTGSLLQRGTRTLNLVLRWVPEMQKSFFSFFCSFIIIPAVQDEYKCNPLPFSQKYSNSDC